MPALTLAWGTENVGTLSPKDAPFLESNSGSTSAYGTADCYIGFTTGFTSGTVAFSYSHTGVNKREVVTPLDQQLDGSFQLDAGTAIGGGGYVDGIASISTTEISATVDGIPCTNTLTLTHANIDTYTGVLTWDSVSAGPPPKFWANLQGVTEP